MVCVSSSNHRITQVCRAKFILSSWWKSRHQGKVSHHLSTEPSTRVLVTDCGEDRGMRYCSRNRRVLVISPEIPISSMVSYWEYGNSGDQSPVLPRKSGVCDCQVYRRQDTAIPAEGVLNWKNGGRCWAWRYTIRYTTWSCRGCASEEPDPGKSSRSVLWGGLGRNFWAFPYERGMLWALLDITDNKFG